jgi:hypothetical protein
MSIKFAPLLRFVASSWGSMPSFIEGDERISAFVKIHCEGVDVEGGRVRVCGEFAIIVDHGEEISQGEEVLIPPSNLNGSWKPKITSSSQHYVWKIHTWCI